MTMINRCVKNDMRNWLDFLAFKFSDIYNNNTVFSLPCSFKYLCLRHWFLYFSLSLFFFPLSNGTKNRISLLEYGPIE